MSFLRPKAVTVPTPPPPPPVAEKVDYERAAAMSEEAVARHVDAEAVGLPL